MTDDKRQKKIFLSYSSEDKDKAMAVADKLVNTGFLVVWENSNPLGANIFKELEYQFQSSDFVLVLLSKSLFHSPYFKFEYTQAFFNQTKQRKITLLPVLIEKCDIPSDFLEYQILDLTKDFDKGIEKLLKKIKTIPEVSFENFNPREFEELIYDLLKAYGFSNIERQQGVSDKGIDFIAEYFSSNPFGQKKKEVWMIETKFYSESRFDIKTIKQIVGLYKYVNKEDAKLLLITNSQLTSVAEEYLNDMRKSNFIEIELIDGLELKNLIASKKSILNKYFL